MAIHIHGKEALDQILEEAGNKLVVLDFMATWCGPCEMIGPRVDEMAKEYLDIVVCKIDVDELEDVATDYCIDAMPTFVFLKNKKVLFGFSGANRRKLKKKIEIHRKQHSNDLINLKQLNRSVELIKNIHIN